MPYIIDERRIKIDFENELAETAGELNYTITSLLMDYITLKGKSYNTYNEIVGALECCKLEFYRKMASPYEDEKCIINGEVYI